MFFVTALADTFAGNNLSAGFLGTFLNLAMITCGLKVFKDLQHNEYGCVLSHCIRTYPVHIACARTAVKPVHPTWEFTRATWRHEITLCDCWVRGYLSSIQRHCLLKIKYANLTWACYCYLRRE